jgi:hypothetical protein
LENVKRTIGSAVPRASSRLERWPSEGLCLARQHVPPVLDPPRPLFGDTVQQVNGNLYAGWGVEQHPQVLGLVPQTDNPLTEFLLIDLVIAGFVQVPVEPTDKTSLITLNLPTSELSVVLTKK